MIRQQNRFLRICEELKLVKLATRFNKSRSQSLSSETDSSSYSTSSEYTTTSGSSSSAKKVDNNCVSVTTTIRLPSSKSTVFVTSNGIPNKQGQNILSNATNNTITDNTLRPTVDYNQSHTVTVPTKTVNVSNGGGASLTSTGSISESSDPVESDFSDDEQDTNKHIILSHTNESDDEESDGETGTDEEQVDSEDESDTESSKISSRQDGKREYDVDDLQIIKTVGTGTFGRVCLVRDKITQKYCALKILAMADVIRLKQVEHVKNEKSILSEVQHPFIVNLLWSSKDDCCLFMLFEYVCGGELFSYLRNAGRFNTPTSNFYACEIILALEYLHSLSIVYRDLKPENLLIDRDGHLKITDFGFAKKLKDRTWTLCGTPEYLAPEIIQSKGHNKAVDWWALGVLIYEMLIGFPPFYDDNPFGIYEKILSGKIDWPRHMDPVAKDLVKKLLVPDRTKRLGNMKNGIDDIKKHRWFKHLDWDDVYNKKLTPPIIPKILSDGDTSNFDEYPEDDWKAIRPIKAADYELFEDF